MKKQIKYLTTTPSDFTRIGCVMALLLALAACNGGGGGGGGGNNSPPPPTSTTCVWDSSTWDNCTFGS
jgi:hypothetical protein